METSCAPSENVQNPLAVLECLCDQLRFPITRAREYILVYREGQDLGPPGSEDPREHLIWYLETSYPTFMTTICMLQDTR